MSYDSKFMKLAIEHSIKNIELGGGPFGAVIVRQGEVIACEGNSVTRSNDPTAHAEVNAIRKACSVLKTFDLSDCEIYSSCEPCPMCLSAIYWAHIPSLYYANTKDDARDIDFDDSFIYEQLALNIEERELHTEQHERDEALVAFEVWRNKTDKTEY